MRTGQGEEGHLLVRLSHAERAAKGELSLEHIAPSSPLCKPSTSSSSATNSWLSVCLSCSHLSPQDYEILNSELGKGKYGVVRPVINRKTGEMVLAASHSRLKTSCLWHEESIHSFTHPCVIHSIRPSIHPFSFLVAQPRTLVSTIARSSNP